MKTSKQAEVYFKNKSTGTYFSIAHSICEYIYVDIKEIILFLNKIIDKNIHQIFQMNMEKAIDMYQIYQDGMRLNQNCKHYMKIFKYFPEDYNYNFSITQSKFDKGNYLTRH